MNIKYDLPEEYWNKLSEIYCNMEGWKGYKHGIPYWFGDDNSVYIEASVEPGGLEFCERMKEWKI